MSGIDGFLGTSGSLGMDVVVVGLLAVLPLLAWSIHVVRTRRDYATHKLLQLTIAVALLVCIVIFEIDIRLVSDWKVRARPSPWWPGGVLTMLGVHLIFAVSTLVLWVWTVWDALVKFPSPPVPGGHGGRHRVMGRLAAIDLVLTTITGLLFYWLAFIA